MKTDSAWKQFLGRRVRMWDPMWDGLNPFYRFYFGSSWAVFRGLVMMSLVFSSFALGALAMGLAVQTDLIFEFLIGLAATWSISTMLFSILPSKKKVARTSSNPVTVSDGGVQCSLRPCAKETSPPDGTIYYAPNGARWHARKTCGHLKHAQKATPLTPCLTCSVESD